MDVLSHPGRQTRFWLFLFGLYILWTGAWLLRVGPVERLYGGWLGDLDHDTLYWTLCKFLVWILPPALYLRRIYGVGLWEYLGLSRWTKRGWFWGLASAAVMAALYLAYDLGAHVPLSGPAHFMPGPFLGAVLVAPFVEETFFRGFMTRQLQGWWKNFLAVNAAATLAWIGVHWVGWYFQGRLSFPQSLGATASLLVLGLLFGYLNRLSGSLWASLILHAANNLYADHFWNYFHSGGVFA